MQQMRSEKSRPLSCASLMRTISIDDADGMLLNDMAGLAPCIKFSCES